jgi:magnesium chelatase subunit I
MATGDLPVTLPIGATDDRVLGGWRVEALMKSDPEWQKGLIEEAGSNPVDPRMLYIDEVNLLDDHLTNIILDVASTGILVVQRDGAAKETIKVNFTLVGTMNPEEGSLRPQLLDRFGLVVLVKATYSPGERAKVLETVLQFEEAERDPASSYRQHGYERDNRRRSELLAARRLLPRVELPPIMIDLAAKVAAEFRVEGHRGELAMLRAARAVAAIEATSAIEALSPTAEPPVVTAAHLALVTPLALVHRRASGDSGTLLDWSAEDDEQVAKLVGIEPT